MMRAKGLLAVLNAVAMLALPALLATPALAQNPDQIEVLKWYGANQTTAVSVDGPLDGVAFDGSSIWVSDQNRTVTKVDPATGQILGAFQVGRTPMGLAFDGAN